MSAKQAKKDKIDWANWPPEPELRNLPLIRVNVGYEAALLAAKKAKGSDLTREELKIVRAALDMFNSWIEVGTKRISLCPNSDCYHIVELNGDGKLTCPEHGVVPSSIYGTIADLAVVFDRLPEDYHKALDALYRD